MAIHKYVQKKFTISNDTGKFVTAYNYQAIANNEVDDDREAQFVAFILGDRDAATQAEKKFVASLNGTTTNPPANPPKNKTTNPNNNTKTPKTPRKTPPAGTTTTPPTTPPATPPGTGTGTTPSANTGGTAIASAQDQFNGMIELYKLDNSPDDVWEKGLANCFHKLDANNKPVATQYMDKGTFIRFFNEMFSPIYSGDFKFPDGKLDSAAYKKAVEKSNPTIEGLWKSMSRAANPSGNPAVTYSIPKDKLAQVIAVAKGDSGGAPGGPGQPGQKGGNPALAGAKRLSDGRLEFKYLACYQAGIDPSTVDDFGNPKVDLFGFVGNNFIPQRQLHTPMSPNYDPNQQQNGNSGRAQGNPFWGQLWGGLLGNLLGGNRNNNQFYAQQNQWDNYNRQPFYNTPPYVQQNQGNWFQRMFGGGDRWS